MTWLQGSSPTLLSNFGMPKGSLVDMVDQMASWWMGSLVSLIKSRIFRLAIKGRLWAVSYYEPVGLVGGAYEVIVKCGIKGWVVELDILGLLGGGLVEEDTISPFIT